VGSAAVATKPRQGAFSLCSLASAASGEDPLGSAWATSRYLLVELALPWEYDLLAGKRIPAGLREFVDELYEAGSDWGLIGMAPDDKYSVPGLVRVIDLALPEPPFRGYARSVYLIPPDELVAALRVMADDPGAAHLDAYRQEPAATRDLLVCTHGAVDACCAKFGYPVYRRLRQIAAESELPDPVRVWRCTHFGGHRFAATVLDMPEGRYWGRLEGRHLPHLVRRDVPMAELRGCYRRWAALPHPLQQIAEGEAFVRGDWAWTACDVTPGGVPPEDATSAEITLSYIHEARGERGEIAVAVLPDGAVMTQTESADPELVEVPHYRTEVRRVVPDDGLLAGTGGHVFPNSGRGHESCGDLAR
jgi:hypothetical protein